jgi:hypothetical protein
MRKERQSGGMDGRWQPATGGALTASVRTSGCDEYIDREARQIPGNKSGAGSAVGPFDRGRLWPYTRIVENEESMVGCIVSPPLTFVDIQV